LTFVNNAAEISRIAMALINPNLVDQYEKVILFLAANPTAAKAKRGSTAPDIGSAEYLRRQAEVFSAARNPRSPQTPATVPDEMVSVILREYFGIPQNDLRRIKREHLLSMGAENLVGELLERYLASILEPRGWIWCSGAMVKAADFVKPPSTVGGAWRLLQVKNRDNSENSSSSAIRDGTIIEKWHRTFSKRVGSNWGTFPDVLLRPHLSEEAFVTFVLNYLRNLPPAPTT
jgi:SinI restriction endonuclease